MSHVITIHSDLSKGKINRNIYGHFPNIWVVHL